MNRFKKNRTYKGHFPKSINLYKFIRLILGSDISDRAIATRWHMDQKNFHEFKTGKYPVPRLEKLEQLAVVLGINKHMVFQVASGTPAQKVSSLVKKNDLPGQTKLLSAQLDEAHTALSKSEKRYRDLFNHASDAIIILEPKTNEIVDANKRAEQFFGILKTESIGMHYQNFIPPNRRKYYHSNYLREIASQKDNMVKTHSLMTRNGKVINVSVSSSTIEIDGKPFIQCICRDITQIKPKPEAISNL